MNTLSFIISPDKSIPWILKDFSGDLINKGVASNLKEFLNIKNTEYDNLEVLCSTNKS